MEHILVAIDGSQRSIDALRWGKELADRMGVGTTAMTIWGPGTHLAFDVPKHLPGGEAPAVYGEALEKSIAEAGLVGVDLVAMEGRASGVLHEAANDPEVLGVVMGTRGLGTIPGLLLGSLSRRMLFDCTTPLFLMPDQPGDQYPRLDRVLVAVDGSAVSGSTAEWGARLCQRLGTDAMVLRCVDPGAELPAGHVDSYLESVRSQVDERWCRHFAANEVPHQVVAVCGDARQQIIETARSSGVGLIVVAGRGAGQFQGLGGTTSYLVRHSPIPVAVVPGVADWQPNL